MQKPRDGEPEFPQSPSAAALYIATMSEQLGHIARRHRLDSLAYILEMARLEASQIANGSPDTTRRPSRQRDG
jgi:hypothetical protein